MTERMKRATRDVFRMSQWFVLAAALYVLTFDFGLQESHPGVQSTIYNLANITARAWFGYWIARHTLGRLRMDGSDHPMTLVARAILIGCVILTSR